MKTIKILFYIAIAIFFTGCASPERKPSSNRTLSRAPAESVVARINREPITFGEWLTAYEESGGAGKYSEAAFLDEYIKTRIGVQRARRLHLDSHPAVSYAKELAIYNKYLDDQFKRRGRGESFKSWEATYLTLLRRTSDIWINPDVTSLGSRKLDGNTVIATVNGEKVSSIEFQLLFKDELKKQGYKNLLSRYIDVKLVNSAAKQRGYVDESYVKVAEEKALFDMVNHIEFGPGKIKSERVSNWYKKERERSDIEVYPSFFF